MSAGSDLSLIMADLDHFKRVNDTHGHMVGDAVLRQIAVRLCSSLRTYDSVGRYGGEEGRSFSSSFQIAAGMGRPTSPKGSEPVLETRV